MCPTHPTPRSWSRRSTMSRASTPPNATPRPLNSMPHPLRTPRGCASRSSASHRTTNTDRPEGSRPARSRGTSCARRSGPPRRTARRSRTHIAPPSASRRSMRSAPRPTGHRARSSPSASASRARSRRPPSDPRIHLSVRRRRRRKTLRKTRARTSRWTSANAWLNTARRSSRVPGSSSRRTPRLGRFSTFESRRRRESRLQRRWRRSARMSSRRTWCRCAEWTTRG
mmetsp:Transcript_11178/g.50669  ORF Transcript_11178/g.50669 Transcript_11178/m.50669 type:complete len:227 (+) Transcript_11178:169-849(+)